MRSLQACIGVPGARRVQGRRRGDITGGHLDPAALAGALRDGVADEHLVVAVRERRVERALGRPAGGDGA